MPTEFGILIQTNHLQKDKFETTGEIWIWIGYDDNKKLLLILLVLIMKWWFYFKKALSEIHILVFADSMTRYLGFAFKCISKQNKWEKQGKNNSWNNISHWKFLKLGDSSRAVYNNIFFSFWVCVKILQRSSYIIKNFILGNPSDSYWLKCKLLPMSEVLYYLLLTFLLCFIPSPTSAPIPNMRTLSFSQPEIPAVLRGAFTAVTAVPLFLPFFLLNKIP